MKHIRLPEFVRAVFIIHYTSLRVPDQRSDWRELCGVPAQAWHFTAARTAAMAVRCAQSLLRRPHVSVRLLCSHKRFCGEVESLIASDAAARRLCLRRCATEATGGDSDAQQPFHIPVMLDQVIKGWVRPESGGSGVPRYVDCTVGGGGHSAALLAAAPQARLLAIDRDIAAVNEARRALREKGLLHSEEGQYRVTFACSSYSTLPDRLQAARWPKQVDGILVDCGFNSSQIADAARGFSFMHNGPLDMRYDSRTRGGSSDVTAADLVNHLPEARLVRMFRDYGDEPFATVVARIIVQRRDVLGKPFTDTLDLAQAVRDGLRRGKWFRKFRQIKDGSAAQKRRGGREHEATRIFQALRIAVNDELGELEAFLDCAPDHLRRGGRLAILTFHSLEDRIVKRRFREWTEAGVMARVGEKYYAATDEEVAANPRARSAKLRVVRKS